MFGTATHQPRLGGVELVIGERVPPAGIVPVAVVAARSGVVVVPPLASDVGRAPKCTDADTGDGATDVFASSVQELDRFSVEQFLDVDGDPPVVAINDEEPVRVVGYFQQYGSVGEKPAVVLVGITVAIDLVLILVKQAGLSQLDHSRTNVCCRIIPIEIALLCSSGEFQEYGTDQGFRTGDLMCQNAQRAESHRQFSGFSSVAAVGPAEPRFHSSQFGECPEVSAAITAMCHAPWTAIWPGGTGGGTVESGHGPRH